MATPFQIDVPEETLIDLRRRLRDTRFPDEVEGAGWDYGTSLSFTRELAEYWAETYDWRKHERFLNGFPQYRANIDGLHIH